MKLALFSDIHGNLRAFEAVLADFATVGEVDKIWLLGDYVAFGAHPAECVAKVRALIEQYGKDKCQAIGGNTDRYLVTGKRQEGIIAKDEEAFAKRVVGNRERDTILNWNLAQLTWTDYEFLGQTLGRELYWRVPNFGDVIGFHAIPGDDEPPSLRVDSPDEEALDALLDREGRLAVAGHTHQRMNRQVGNWQVVNPGSIGMSFTQSGMAEWALLTFEDNQVQVDLRAVAYDLEGAIADIHAVGYPFPSFIESRLRAQF